MRTPVDLFQAALPLTAFTSIDSEESPLGSILLTPEGLAVVCEFRGPTKTYRVGFFPARAAAAQFDFGLEGTFPGIEGSPESWRIVLGPLLPHAPAEPGYVRAAPAGVSLRIWIPQQDGNGPEQAWLALPSFQIRAVGNSPNKVWSEQWTLLFDIDPETAVVVAKGARSDVGAP